MLNNKWIKRNGKAYRITVDGLGVPYIVTRKSDIYKWSIKNKRWTLLRGKANDIGVGPQGELWIIGSDKEKGGYGIYHM